MRARRVTLAALATFSASVGLVPAAAHADSTSTIYVDSANPNCVGYATGSGTQADPYCGLNNLTTVSPGTTVLVAPGKGYTSGVQLSYTGDTSTAPVVFTGVGGHVQVHGGFRFQNRDDIVVQGFDFTDGGVWGFVGAQNISVLDNTFTATGPFTGEAIGGATTVVGNKVTGPYTQGIGVNGGAVDHVTGAPGTPNLVDGNDVSGIAAGGDGIGVYGYNVQISNNRVHDNDGAGISSRAALGGAVAVRIVGNLIWANGGPGVSVTTGITDYITSNTIVGNNGAQVSISDQPYGHGPAFIRNNIIAGHDGTMPSYAGPTAAAPLVGIQTDTASWSSTSIDSDIVDVPGGTAYSNTYATFADAAALRKTTDKGAHEITASPGLNADGTLRAGSPAIDSADSGADGEQAWDLDNAPRVDVASVADTGLGTRTYDDRGAEEFGSTPAGPRTPAPAPPVLAHTDCGVAAVPYDPAIGNPNQPSLSSTDLPPLGSDGHNQFQGTPAVVHVHSSGGTGGIACYKFAVGANVSETSDTTVVAADAQGNADLIVKNYTWGSQALNVVAIDTAGRQSPQGTYMFYAVGGGSGYSMALTTAGVAGQPLAADVTGQAVGNVLAVPLPSGYSYEFSFGDGSQPVIQTGTTVRHVFPKPGVYAVAVRMLDDTGAIVTENAQYVSVPLAAPAPPPGGGATPPPPGGGTGTPPPPAGVAVNRVFGQDRFATGVNVSMTQWPAGQAKSVVLARGGTFPDALSGVPLAAHRQGPLLLTETTALSPAVATEIRRVLGADASKTVYILGGTGAVSTDVEKAVRALGYQVVRYGGDDRFATALQVAQSFGPTTHVVVATGQNFPDALSAGPLGAVEDAPIVLSQDLDLDPATAAFVKSHAAIETVGRQADLAVRAHVGVTGRTYLPLWGEDRYLTSKAVAQAVVVRSAGALGRVPTGVGLASGQNFPDALTGGAYAANAGQPLLLTDPALLPGPIGDELATLAAQLRTVTIFGGENAVSKGVEYQVLARVHGHY